MPAPWTPFVTMAYVSVGVPASFFLFFDLFFAKDEGHIKFVSLHLDIDATPLIVSEWVWMPVAHATGRDTCTACLSEYPCSIVLCHDVCMQRG